MKFFNAGSNIKYFKGSYETGYRFKNLDLDYNITAKRHFISWESLKKNLLIIT